MILIRFILFLLFTFSSILGYSQNTAANKVQDENGMPLVGANIVAIPSLAGTISDADGYFMLKYELGDTALYVSYTGYTTAVLDLPLQTPAIVLSKGYTSDEVQINYYAETSEALGTEQLDFDARPAVSYSSVDQIVNTVPGIYMQSAGPNTNRLTIRGNGNRSPFASSGIKIYIDDIPVHSASGESALEDFGTNIINKAEIIKGPTGPEYGSGLTGAVVIQTDDGLYSPRASVQTHNEVGPYGTYRTENTFEYTSKPVGTTHKLRVNQSVAHSDGYRSNNVFDRSNLALSYRLRAGDHTLRLLANRVDLKAQIPGALGLTDYREDPRQAAFIWQRAEGNEANSRTLIGLKHSYSPNSNFKWTMIAYTNQLDADELRPFNTIEENVSTYGLRLKARHHFAFEQSDLSVTLGSDLQMEDYSFDLFETDIDSKGAGIGNGGQDLQTGSGYITVDYWLDSGWQFSLGAEYLHFCISGDATTDYTQGMLFPTFTIAKEFGWHRYYFKAGQGGNFPSADMLSNLTTDLQPELGINIELGLKGYFPNSRVGYRLSAYRMNVRDQFVQRFAPDETSFTVNGGSSILYGVEATLRRKWLKPTAKHRLASTLSANYNHHRFDQFVDGAADYSGNDLTGSPPLLLQTSTDYRYGRLYVGLSAQYVANYPIDDANTTYNEHYTLLHSRISYELVAHKNWNIAIGTRLLNLLNTEYASMTSVNAGAFGGAEARYYYGGYPRQVMATLTGKYSW